MKQSFTIRLPYKDKNGFFEDNFTLQETDIIELKNKAKYEGRSLRTYIAYHLIGLARGRK